MNNAQAIWIDAVSGRPVERFLSIRLLFLAENNGAGLSISLSLLMGTVNKPEKLK
jgi:hypothetical protein